MNAHRIMLLSKFSPARLYRGAPGLWTDASDFSTGFQDSAATTGQTAATEPTGLRRDKSGNSIHLAQATAGLRPVLSVPPFSDTFDRAAGSALAATFAAGTLVAGMDCFIAMKKTTTDQCVLAYSSAGAAYMGGVVSGSGASAAGDVGASATVYINGTQVPGGTSTTQDQLNAAMPVNSWCVFEAHGLDMSLWNGFGVGGYGAGYDFSGLIHSIVLCRSQTDSVRSQIRRFLANKVGATL
jgi:hypothetical protein